MAIIIRRMIVQVADEIRPGDAGPTIGDRIDEQIADALDAGSEIQSIRVELSEEDWAEMVKLYKESGRGQPEAVPIEEWTKPRRR